MSDLSKRLRASVKFDAINGSSSERAICGKQMIEAALEIERLTYEIEVWKSVFPDIAPEQVLPDRSALERKLEAYRHALLELRLRFHAQGRRPEECYEMRLIDAAMAKEKRDE